MPFYYLRARKCVTAILYVARMARLLSPRKLSFDAWVPRAQALLKAKPKISHVCVVTISAALFHGEEQFFKKFRGHDSVEDFLKEVDPIRSSLFVGGRKLTTEVALLCIWAAEQLVKIHSAYSTTGELKAKLFEFLQTFFATDRISTYGCFNEADHITKLVDLICTMSLWKDARGALLCPNTQSGPAQQFLRELSVVGEMYECEPTREEKDTAVVEEIFSNIQGAGASVCGAVKCVVRAVKSVVRAEKGTPAVALPPPKEWYEAALEDGIKVLHHIVWLSAMIYVRVSWLHAQFQVFAADHGLFEQEMQERVSSDWDVVGLIYVFVMTHWRGRQGKMLFSMFIGMLSLHSAHSWPLIKRFYLYSGVDNVDCWNEWSTAGTIHAPLPFESQCDSGYNAIHILMTNIYYRTATVVGCVFLADVATVAAVFYRNENVSSASKVYVHTSFCSGVCTLYLFMNFVHSGHNVLWVRHTLNVVVFIAALLQTLHESYSAQGVGGSKTSRLSLLACRMICIVVITTECVVLMYRGKDNWTYYLLIRIFDEVYRVYVLVFIFQFVAFLIKLISHDKRNVFAGAW